MAVALLSFHCVFGVVIPTAPLLILDISWQILPFPEIRRKNPFSS